MRNTFAIKHLYQWFICVSVLLVLMTLYQHPVLAEPATMQNPDEWLEDDSEWRSLMVNEGELVFLQPITDKKVLFLHHRLILNEHSIDSGWVRLEQCYRELDQVRQTQIEYNYQQMQQLQVSLAENIQRAWVDGQTVQLWQVGKDAVLCISARVQILHSMPNQHVYLFNGPFHRRFLHGYYPYHIRLEVLDPLKRLKLYHHDPASQALFQVKPTAGGAELESWFEGLLNIYLEFEVIKQ